MKRVLKIIFINIIVIILMFTIVDIYCSHEKVSIWLDNFLHTKDVDTYFTELYAGIEQQRSFTKAFRRNENENSDKKPVIFTGCSFFYGENLSDEEAPSAVFARISGRPVYNRAGRGWGLAQFLYQTRREEFYSSVKEEPEYIIYNYIYDHCNRLDKFKILAGVRNFQPKYKVKKNKLVLQKPHFYDKYYIIEDYQYHHNYIHDNISDDIIKLYFTEAEKEIHRHWPNTKLVITVYPTFGLGDILCGVFNELKNENYNNVIYLDKIVDVNLESKEYLDDSAHPNAKAWEKIMPKLIDYLNI